jgi:hypothetical protein
VEPALLISKLVDEQLQRSYSVLGGGQAGNFSVKSLGVAVGRGIGTNQRIMLSTGLCRLSRADPPFVLVRKADEGD